MTSYPGIIVVCWFIRATTGELQEKYVGCFLDNNNQKLEPVLKDADDLTIETCIHKCHNEFYQHKSFMTYAALTNGRICTCRNSSGEQLHDRLCNVKCSGSPLQFCGGIASNEVFSLYTVCPVGYFGEECDQSCHCKRHLPCDRETGICSDGCDDRWTGTSCDIRSNEQLYIGCYGDGKDGHKAMDASNPGGRLRMTNTIEACIEICSTYKYTYAGMQYGYDCNCGEKYNRYGMKTHDGKQVNCSFPCDGNKTLKCGGNYTNSVYYVCPKGFYGRNCVNRCHCSDGGPCRFNGTCLNSTISLCKSGWTGSACNIRDCVTSNGDCESDEICEIANLGYANLSVCRCKDGSYRDNNTCIPTHLHYVGCFKGNTAQHVAAELPTSEELTIEFCLLKCKQLNKAFAIIQGGTACFCGDEYGQISPDVECQVPCAGDKLQYCGGTSTADKTPVYSVYTVNDLHVSWCSNDTDCKRNEACSGIDLNYMRISRCRCKSGFYRMYSREECKVISEEPIHTDAVVITLVILILAIAFLVFGLLWCWRKQIFVKKEESDSMPIDEHSVHSEDESRVESKETSIYNSLSKKPSSNIPVGELPVLFKTKLSHPGTLEKEFKSVPVEDSSKTCREGKKKELKSRNRFRNIIPYDQNRVILLKSHNKSCDYINASFIKSYNNEEKLIASQGPNPETLTDFWQMIYENNVGTVVMITNLVENGKKKCASYWPDSAKSVTYDDMTITLKSTENMPDYVIRHLQLTKGSSSMDIKQWHFTVWPDHGVPSDVKGFLNFRRNVRQSMSLDKHTVVHCSAGVGRTGTFIAINYLLEQADAEGIVDIVGCLRFLRKQRTQMVQTLDQYKFIYAALATEFTIGKTIINAEDFNRTYQNLLIRDKLSGKSKLEIQFQVLQEQCEQQVESENPSHVFAKSLDVDGIGEAAQAVFVQSWKTKDAYIVSEYPDKATVTYFWTICMDYGCKFIIYLDNGQNSPLFFPTQPTEWLSVDSWSLQCKSSDSENYGMRHQIALTHMSESQYQNATNSVSVISGEVTLMNVKANMSDSKLNYNAIHATYNTIKALDSKNKSANPVVIVSRPDCALSGLFVAAFNAFDMLDGAKEVDLYQVVYDIKKSRSKLIPSVATYEELHNIVNHRIEHSSSASVYCNV